MNRFLKNKILLAVILLGIIGYAVFQKVSFNSPEDIGVKFFKSYGTVEMADYLKESDVEVYKKSLETFKEYSPLSLVKVPVSTVVLKEVIESENHKKVFYEVDGRKLGLLLINENYTWKVDLDLDKYHRIYLAKVAIGEASALGDEDALLEAYNQMQLLDPQPEYDESIKTLAAKIARRQELQQYVQNVIISGISSKNNIVTAFIQNVGKKTLIKVEAKIEIVDAAGTVVANSNQVIFERLVGSKLYKDPLPPGYEKKVSFDLSSLSSDLKKLNIKITPIAVDYLD